jgi:hypothetical protein
MNGRAVAVDGFLRDRRAPRGLVGGFLRDRRAPRGLVDFSASVKCRAHPRSSKQGTSGGMTRIEHIPGQLRFACPSAYAAVLRSAPKGAKAREYTKFQRKLARPTSVRFPAALDDPEATRRD